MNVPLLDLKAQLKTIREDVLAAVTDVVDSTRYVLGPKVEALESRVADYSGVDYGIGVSSGTDALLVSLMALDVHAGHTVITTPFSFFATAGAIVRLGAQPVFVDIDSATHNISPQKLSEYLDSQKKKENIKAIIPVHLFGQTADMDPIADMCGARNIAVIEDGAQAIGAQYPSRHGVKKAGSMGQMGCFSFFPSKNLGCIGDGGMVVTQDPQLAAKLKILRNHGAKPKYYHSLVGGNFRLDPIQAAVLLVKLQHLDDWSRSRRLNADRYDALFSQSGLVEDERIRLPKRIWKGEDMDNYHIFNQYVIRIEDGRRDDFRGYLAEAGIGTEVYYPVPFHLQECFRHLGYKKGDFPESEAAAEKVLALPIYPELFPEMQEYVVEKTVRYFRA